MNELAHVLQNEIEILKSTGVGVTNASSPRMRLKKPEKEIVPLTSRTRRRRRRSTPPPSLGQALATAFTYNPANPQVASSARHSPTTARVEVVIALER